MQNFLEGVVLPDSYAVFTPPNRGRLHVLVELDRGTETLERVRDKAERYEHVWDCTFLGEVDPLVLFIVPSGRRARTVTNALAGMGRSLAVIEWSKDAAVSALPAVLDAETRHRLAREWQQRREREEAGIRRDAQAAPSGGHRDRGDSVERLRSARASDLLDHPQHPDEQETTP